MSTLPQKSLSCRCGAVVLAVSGAHIITVACYCDDCQAAAQKLATLSGAASSAILEADGGTHFVLHRKDRVSCLSGSSELSEYRLTPKSPSRRIIATCCNTPLFLEFEKGHWLSLYKKRFAPGDQPLVEQRTMAKYKRADVHFTDHIPSPPSHTLSFMGKLIVAWAAMKFQTPSVSYVKRTLEI